MNRLHFPLSVFNIIHQVCNSSSLPLLPTFGLEPWTLRNLPDLVDGNAWLEDAAVVWSGRNADGTALCQHPLTAMAQKHVVQKGFYMVKVVLVIALQDKRSLLNKLFTCFCQNSIIKQSEKKKLTNKPVLKKNLYFSRLSNNLVFTSCQCCLCEF